MSTLTKALAGLTFLAVIAGSIVTSTRSGLSDEHWPSFGGRAYPSLSEMLESHPLLFEHGHRTLVGLTGLLTWTVAFLLCRSASTPRAVKRLALTASCVILVPAVLGGLTVLLKLKVPQISIFHVSMAMLTLGLNCSLAVVTGRRWSAAPGDSIVLQVKPDDANWLACGSAACAVSIYAQIILGAVPRHMQVGAVPHILWAFAVFTAVVMVAGRILSRHAKLAAVFAPGMLLLVLVVAQFFLGFTTFVVRPDVAKAPGTTAYEVTATLHIVTGALMLAVSVVLLLRCFQLRSVVKHGVLPAGSIGATA